MKKITIDELQPLAELLTQEALTIADIQDRCQITQRQAYRYLDVLRTGYQVVEGKVRSGAPKTFKILGANPPAA